MPVIITKEKKSMNGVKFGNAPNVPLASNVQLYQAKQLGWDNYYNAQQLMKGYLEQLNAGQPVDASKIMGTGEIARSTGFMTKV